MFSFFKTDPKLFFSFVVPALLLVHCLPTLFFSGPLRGREAEVILAHSSVSSSENTKFRTEISPSGTSAQSLNGFTLLEERMLLGSFFSEGNTPYKSSKSDLIPAGYQVTSNDFKNPNNLQTENSSDNKTETADVPTADNQNSLPLENPPQKTKSPQNTPETPISSPEPEAKPSASDSFPLNNSLSTSEIPMDQSKTPSEEEIISRQEAYERSLLELLPAGPEEIQQMRSRADSREKALADSPVGQLKTRTERLTLEPGFIPPIVYLTPNLVTALVFLDSTGSPFPVTSSILGNGAIFKTEILPQNCPNQVIISALGNHGQSNLIVNLFGEDLPLVIRLETTSRLKEERRVDGLIIYQIQSRGPLARPQTNLTPPALPVNDLLYTILDGLSPPGALRLLSDPEIPKTSIFQSESTIYIRTESKLLWPAYTGKVEGPGGFTVYEIPAVSSLIFDQKGTILRLFLTNARLDPEVL